MNLAVLVTCLRDPGIIYQLSGSLSIRASGSLNFQSNQIVLLLLMLMVLLMILGYFWYLALIHSI